MSMIEVQDEILEGEPLYRLINKDTGEIILDNIAIEMITGVIQAGTPLNKLLFDSIKQHIDELKTEIITKTAIVSSNGSTSIDLTQYTNGYHSITILLNKKVTTVRSSGSSDLNIYGTKLYINTRETTMEYNTEISKVWSYDTELINVPGMIHIDYDSKIIIISANTVDPYVICSFESLSELEITCATNAQFTLNTTIKGRRIVE